MEGALFGVTLTGHGVLVWTLSSYLEAGTQLLKY